MNKRYFFVAFLLLLFSFPLWAHPGIGLVEDSKGNIYYTDLKQVWKLAPDGSQSVAVPEVHTHQLYMDANDNLYGENLIYEGDATKKFNHYLWVLHPDGKLETVIGPKPAFETQDYSLVRDSIGNQYWLQQQRLSRFMKQSTDGEVTQLAEGFYNNVKWLYATPGGTLYFINGNALYKIDSTHLIRPVAKNLSETTDSFAFASPNNDLMGIWSDQKNNVYVAVFSGQVIKKIAPNGVVSMVERSENGWSPTAGLFDKAGDLWVMEYNAQNQVRVRKVVNFTGTPKGSSPKQKIIVTAAVFLGLISALVILRFSGRRKH